MNTFIRVAEVWVPSSDGSLLELAGGLFDAAPALGAISRSLCFGRAEGLPGRAWDEARPLLLRQLEGSDFRRTAAARAAGLTCAVALPIFLGDALTSVVVLLCGDSRDHVGAIELWHNDPRVTGDLRLSDGYFGTTAADVEALSRDGSLPRGAGLPGLAWQREAAVFIDNTAVSHHFLRAQVAARAGIVRALAIPCSTPRHETWILSLLASSGTPMAHRVESWLPDESATHLRRAFGCCEVHGRLAADEAPAWAIDELGPIGRAWRTGIAQISTRRASPEASAGVSPLASPFPSVLALPITSGDDVAEVLALHF
jgi:hypothetical protein